MPESEYGESVQEVIELIAEEAGVTPGQVETLLERQYGIDLSEVTDEEADDLLDAYQSGDYERVAQFLRDHDVDEGLIEEFRTYVESAGPDPEPDDSASRETSIEPSQPDTNGQAGGGGVSRQEVQQMIRRETPSADEIAAQLKSEMDQGGGGGDGQTQVAAAIAQKFLESNQGPSFGQMMQKQAMKEWTRKMSRPSFGEIMEMKMYENMADQMEIPEEMVPSPDDLFGDMDLEMFEEEEEEAENDD